MKKSVPAAPVPTSMRPVTKAGVVQAQFKGFTKAGGAFGPSALAAAPANLDVFPGGANNAVGGQQAGATARQIPVASRTPYAAPGQLGGFNHFSNLLGKRILRQPGAAAKRYTHLHIINGKTHGPGTPDNLTLGSTGDNNAHRTQVEDAIRNGLPAADTVTPYVAALNLQQPFHVTPAAAYWNIGGVAVPGAVAAPVGSKVPVLGVMKPYTYKATVDPTATKDRRWVDYTIAPTYIAAHSPTIKANMAAVLADKHQDALDDLDTDLRHTLGPAYFTKAYHLATIAAAQAALVLAGGAAAMPAGVPGALAAANAVLNPPPVGGGPDFATYQNTALTLQNDLAAFAAWVPSAFPQSLVADATLYGASYDPAQPFVERVEAQETIKTNRN